ncbi:MAG TPA: quinolinate synthase [Rhodospirillaceae bacterium]|jgi:quinolinate synthase|nr:quinolinate synthase NadA [Alphaproteobacteria bacterium]HBH27066.1 quinolinate synthase [Rhodospirillaceae bacterium]
MPTAQEIYEQSLSGVYMPEHWAALAPLVDEINTLKRAKNAIILAHNYMTPDIFYGVADVVGDSLALAQKAAATDADIIVQAGVHFMAETSKLLCPDKTVLIPDLEAGCSLAASITADDVALIREKYPGAAVVTYVNTSAAVKAASDYCCTSGNALKIVESIPHEEIIFLPDAYLADFVAGKTAKTIRAWKGTCEVHERFTPADITKFRADFPGVVVLAHPECPPEVLAEVDYTGSTAQMQAYVERERPARVVLLTECSMSDNIAAANPDIEMVRTCQLCPHMKRITLPKILRSLKEGVHEVTIPDGVAVAARRAVQRMLELS